MEQQLLQWGLANAPPNSLPALNAEIQAGKRPDLNPEMLKHIMGESDAEKIMRCFKVLKRSLDEGEPASEREVTWESLEMLVADLDNANDLENMKLWPVLIEFLQAKDDLDKFNALWICGTAIQNNEKSQNHFLAQNPLPLLNSIVLDNPSAETRSKAIYCISGCLKHNEKTATQWLDSEGVEILHRGLTDPSLVMRRRTSWLLITLLTQSTSTATLVQNLRKPPSPLHDLLSSLSPSTSIPTGPDGDSEGVDAIYRENALKAILMIVGSEGEGNEEALNEEEKKKVSQALKEMRETEKVEWEDLGLASSEGEKLLRL
ncbi:hypothetical protein BT69DRAFT_1239382 [Atractiella rhizophila]|nr:hypothetical protein BT69DRAFT_1239382 [Atractiella rhizophila]